MDSARGEATDAQPVGADRLDIVSDAELCATVPITGAAVRVSWVPALTPPASANGNVRDRRTVKRDDVPIELTAREFDLLAVLAERAGRVVTRLDILDGVWDGETDLRSNAIDVHVANLRAKVDRPFGRESIRTVRGIGFCLADGPTG